MSWFQKFKFSLFIYCCWTRINCLPCQTPKKEAMELTAAIRNFRIASSILTKCYQGESWLSCETPSKEPMELTLVMNHYRRPRRSPWNYSSECYDCQHSIVESCWCYWTPGHFPQLLYWIEWINIQWQTRTRK